MSSGCGCKEVHRFPNNYYLSLLLTPLVSFFFAAAFLPFVHFLNVLAQSKVKANSTPNCIPTYCSHILSSLFLVTVSKFSLKCDSVFYILLIQEVSDEVVMTIGQAFEIAYQKVMRARSKTTPPPKTTPPL